MDFKTLDKVDLKEKKVLLRLDINAALEKKHVLDSPRFKSSAVTISELIKKKAKVIIIAHQGRKGDDDFCSLEQHALILSKHTKKKIEYVDSLFEQKALDKIESLKPGQAILLKNVREYDDEKNITYPNNKYFQFCKKFDIFVNDAFSVCHREQGSIIIPPTLIPAYVGRGMQKELEALEKINFKDNKSSLFFIGGSKIEDYLPLFNVLDNKKNKIVASGVLANLFLVDAGNPLLYEKVWLTQKGYSMFMPQIHSLAQRYKGQIILPIDLATGVQKREEYTLYDFPKEAKIWDVGKKTMELYKKELGKAKAVFMKGPIGFSENPLFKDGTVSVLTEMSRLTKARKLFSLLGGGHLTTSIQKYKIPNKFSYISLSGGALIAYVSGKTLPGLEALKK